MWRVILGEELGEADQEFLRLNYGERSDPDRVSHYRKMIEEWTQVAAVAICAVEQFRREQFNAESLILNGTYPRES
jgi:hypothetical protein